MTPGKRHLQPYDQYLGEKRISENGLDLIAIYHSHPEGCACLSETDMFFARGWDCIQVVIAISLATWRLNSSQSISAIDGARPKRIKSCDQVIAVTGDSRWMDDNVGGRIGVPNYVIASRSLIKNECCLLAAPSNRCIRVQIMDVDSLDLKPTPEEEELALKRKELLELEGRLVESELHLATLKGELTTFETHYLKVVGVHYAELDDIEAQIAEFLAQISPGNLKAQETAESARTGQHTAKIVLRHRPVLRQLLARIYLQGIAVGVDRLSKTLGRFLSFASPARSRSALPRLYCVIAQPCCPPQKLGAVAF